MKDFEIKDTTSIQVNSLNNFMAVLGYHPHESSQCFVSDWPGNRHARTISVYTAVKLHNLAFVEWVPDKKLHYRPAGFEHIVKPINRYQFNALMAMRAVHEVYLVANKKRKTLHVNQHFVKFRDAYYPYSLGIVEIAYVAQ